MKINKDYFAFDRSEEAHGLARKKSRYGHRIWLVWKANGLWLIATSTVESLEAAITASNGNRFFAYGTDGTLTAVHPPLAQIMLRNARLFAGGDSGQSSADDRVGLSIE